MTLWEVLVSEELRFVLVWLVLLGIILWLARRSQD